MSCTYELGDVITAESEIISEHKKKQYRIQNANSVLLH